VSELASPFAGLDAVRLHDGRYVVIYNSDPAARNPLSIAVSEDEGRSWSTKRDLVIGEGEFHYPAVIQDRDRQLHVTFTNNRKTIDHVVLDPDWLDGKGQTLRWVNGERALV
jgi:predicted neuraminidase